MKLRAFRITNFRSIVDSQWRSFSTDNVTVLVGQNESGKTSVLEAITKALNNEDVTADDCRTYAPLPSVGFRLNVGFSELGDLSAIFTADQLASIDYFLSHSVGDVTLWANWKRDLKKPDSFSAYYSIENFDLASLAEVSDASSPDSKATPKTPETPSSFADEFVRCVFRALPFGILFEHESSLLPNQVDIDTNKKTLTGAGEEAALNFLRVSGIDLGQLIDGDHRAKAHILKQANDSINADFANFWTQTIGRKERITLNCSLQHHDSRTPEKAGKPHLAFLISDGQNQLYPKQRSLGVRWFISFYLQMRASEIDGSNEVFLLDEPGANLHAKAQADVLRLINKLSEKIIVMYSTHSPHMLEHDKLYRVLAVQRAGENDNAPTTVSEAHHLASASSDTLSPILTAMGVDLSHQRVIQKHDNVILEEISGYYYLTAFWRLVPETPIAHFIAATGVNKVETLANMFLGWGLDFIVAVDDDKNGREVYNKLKLHMCANDEDIAKNKLLKFKGFEGIEDVFSQSDFKKLILRDTTVEIAVANSQYAKHHSKPVLAYQFEIAVRKGEIKWADLDGATQASITKVVTDVSRLLEVNSPQGKKDAAA